MCKIAILERYALLSSGIRSILQVRKECELIVQAKSVHELVNSLNGSIPDVIIFNVISAENSGMKPLKNLRRKFPKVPVLLIVSEHYVDCFEEYIRMGVKGLLFNTSDGEDLVDAIKKLKQGKEYFPVKVWKVFKESIQSHKPLKVRDKTLTDREVSIVKLFSNGLTYKEIGAQLNISPRTVETHKRNILTKLKIHTTADMVKYAYRNNILT
ncbi:response regulator transcription factor [Maribellus sediminis]|uniref:response regulator transcription factor n=1 Tax=Maribellus sediminis TaxID=2696285 RepID=UPI001431AF61|nr:response regulator transcription factor [Maribellus sediminis]